MSVIRCRLLETQRGSPGTSHLSPEQFFGYRETVSSQEKCSGRDRLILFLATGLGFGYAPLASGTVGAIWGVGLSCLSALLPELWHQVVLAAALVAVAIPLCDRAERIFGIKDDHRIVADEYLTFPLCTIALPVLEYPWLLAAAFVVNRLLDVLKPPPARAAQNLQGGLGVVLDDAVSSLYALGLLHLGWWWLKG